METERELLGAMLMSKAALEDGISTLSSEHFEDEKHRTLFRAMSKLYDDDRAVDIVTVCEALGPRLAAAGGASYVGGLQDVLGVNHEEYIRIVLDRHARGTLSAVASMIETEVKRGADPIEIADTVESKVGVLGADSRRLMLPLYELVKPAYEAALHANENPAEITGTATGFTHLDDLLSGAQPQDFIVLAGRPSMGKTALALNMMVNIASDGGRVAFFSLEMSNRLLTQRLLSSEGGVSARRLRRGGMDPTDLQQLLQACTWAGAAPIWIDESPAATVREIRRKSRRLKMREGLAAVFVDYLQLMGGEGSEYERVTGASMGLKSLAKELDVPVFGLSQLSRALEDRPNKRPMLSDLRSSGQIEQDADTVLFLYRPVVYDKDAPEELAELNVAKQRNGPIGRVYLRWSKNITRFDNPSIVEEQHWKMGGW